MKKNAIPPVLSAVAACAMLVALAFIVDGHSGYLSKCPLWLPSLAISVGAGLVLVLPNLAGVRLRAALRWSGYGVVATVGAFALQSLLNGSLVRFFGADSISNAIPSIVLGAGAALCQTLGKLAAVRAGMIGVSSKDDPLRCLTIGLGVGLGFGVCETFLLGIQSILTGVPVDSLVGALERASATGFHIYSAGLIAVALALRSMGPFFLVLAIHTGMDSFSAALGHRIPLWISESVFALFALATWGCWIVASKRMRTGMDGRT